MPEEKKPKLKLVGQDGNAFAILARANAAGRKAGWDADYRKMVFDEMRAGDYNHLLATAMKYFEVR